MYPNENTLHEQKTLSKDYVEVKDKHVKFLASEFPYLGQIFFKTDIITIWLTKNNNNNKVYYNERECQAKD